MKETSDAIEQGLRLRWPGDDRWAVCDDSGRLQWSDVAPAPLVPDTELARAGIGGTGTVYVGSSDRVLNALADAQPASARLVYMDPPYNTGRTFSTYRDNEDSALWATMMRQVLQASHRMLRPDGSLWVHLDDGEVHRVRLLAEEVFGAGNFVADVVWERKRKPSFLHGQIAQVTDHILVLARDRSALGRFTTDEVTPARRVPLHHGANERSVLAFPAGSVRFPPNLSSVPAGDMSSTSVVTELLDDITVRDGVNAQPFRMSGSFRWNQQRLDTELAAGTQLHVSSRLPLRPNATTGSGSRTWTTLFTRATGMVTNESAREHQRALFGDGGFDTPKPEELLARIIETATDPGDLVVDPFGGSGTTAAVAHKLGRRWVTAELSRATVDRYIVPRLMQVVDGTDRGGVSVRRAPSVPVALPEGLTPRQARLAAQWLSDLATRRLVEHAADVRALSARMRELAAATKVVEEWHGGGGFSVWSTRAVER